MTLDPLDNPLGFITGLGLLLAVVIIVLGFAAVDDEQFTTACEEEGGVTVKGHNGHLNCFAKSAIIEVPE